MRVLLKIIKNNPPPFRQNPKTSTSVCHGDFLLMKVFLIFACNDTIKKEKKVQHTRFPNNGLP